MPKTIVVAAEKGGIGKTTISEELAFSFERTGVPFEYVDLDGQGGTRHRGHADAGAVVCIVDTPATLPVDTRPDVASAIEHADLVIMPMRPTPYDLQPTSRTLEVLSSMTSAPVLVVVTAANRFKVAQQVIGWIRGRVGEGNVLTLPQAEAFPQSQGLGCSVVKLGRNTPAAIAVRHLANDVRGRLGLPAESIDGGEKELRDNGR